MPRRLPRFPPARRLVSRLGAPGRTTACRIACAAILAPAILATIPTVANARTYVVRQCNDGAGHPLEVAPGFVSLWENRIATDGCPTGGTLSFTMPNNTLAPFGTNGQSMGYSFVLPAASPNTKIVAVEAQLTVPPMTGDTTYSYGDVSLHSEQPRIFLDNFAAGSWGGLPNVNRGANIPAGTRFARFLVYCYGPCNFQGAPSMSMGAAAVTIDDPLPPAVPTFEASGLLDGTPQQGTRKLRFGTVDADSGIRRIEVRTAAGAQLATTPDGQGCSFTRPIPCPQERLQEEFSIDTTRLTDGIAALELWVTDAAGSERRTALAPITIRNAPAPVETPAPPAPVTPKVTFKVSSTKPRRGSRVKFSGTVSPVPATAGRVLIEAKSGKRWITAAVLRTREGGAFRWSHKFSRRGGYTMRARLLSSVEAKTRPAVSAKRAFRVR